MKINFQLFAVIALFGAGVVLSRQFYSTASTQDLWFMLYPLQAIVSLFGGLSFEALPEGYYHAGEDVLINSSCAGINFWLISLSTWFGWLLLAAKPVAYLLRALLVLIPVSWAFALLVNASRILFFIKLNHVLPGGGFPLDHFEAGALIYLSALLSSMLVLRKLSQSTPLSYA